MNSFRSSSEEPCREPGQRRGGTARPRGRRERGRREEGAAETGQSERQEKRARGVGYVGLGLDLRPPVEERRDGGGMARGCRQMEGSLAILHRKGWAGKWSLGRMGSTQGVGTSPCPT
mmetsp:Transcript_18717/g.56548  ORF Transcript_18717/g.56548 Transcript_18717/m.56548 type:complete len:118 (-) Transcript_18717:470-823(-)